MDSEDDSQTHHAENALNTDSDTNVAEGDSDTNSISNDESTYNDTKHSSETVDDGTLFNAADLYIVLNHLWTFLGIICSILCGVIFAKYMQEMHETMYWFTHIKQVEREISLRTEAGFYYSYFKQLVDSNVTISDGIDKLLHDSRTEHPRVINALQRFNIYPEVLIALAYRLLKNISLIPSFAASPILFYVYSCFAISGFSIMALYFLTWTLTKSWLFGFLVAAWMTVNHLDSARVFFAVNMRENFALPFLWLQNLALLVVIGPSFNISKKYACFYMLNTFLFALFWQFNQFVLLLQSLALLLLTVINPALNSKIRLLLLLQLVGTMFSMVAQFVPPFTVISISTSFAISAIVILYFSERVTERYISNVILTNFIKLTLVAGMTIAVNNCARSITGIEADSHIWNFVKAKAGITTEGPVPLETSFYLCHVAFGWIDSGFFTRTKSSGVLPIYCIATLVTAVVAVNQVFRKPNQKKSKESTSTELLPTEMFFLVIQSIPFAVMAVFTLRMKYLWYPYIAVISAYSIYLLSKIIRRIPVSFIAAAIATGLLVRHYPVYQEEIADEKEFWDPETVELMEWISANTPVDSSWAGTMQLMAGVKACTGRKLVNHPHFEDKWLRNRTSKIYQIYARRSVKEVYNILRNEAVDFVILEESVCRAPSHGCSTKDLVDLDNGILPEYYESSEIYANKLRISYTPRFCNRIQKHDNETRKYFNLVFENEKFRIFEILTAENN